MFNHKMLFTNFIIILYVVNATGDGQSPDIETERILIPGYSNEYTPTILSDERGNFDSTLPPIHSLILQIEETGSTGSVSSNRENDGEEEGRIYDTISVHHESGVGRIPQGMASTVSGERLTMVYPKDTEQFDETFRHEMQSPRPSLILPRGSMIQNMMSVPIPFTTRDVIQSSDPAGQMTTLSTPSTPNLTINDGQTPDLVSEIITISPMTMSTPDVGTYSIENSEQTPFVEKNGRKSTEKKQERPKSTTTKESPAEVMRRLRSVDRLNT